MKGFAITKNDMLLQNVDYEDAPSSYYPTAQDGNGSTARDHDQDTARDDGAARQARGHFAFAFASEEERAAYLSDPANRTHKLCQLKVVL